jgi:hypothetical protein
MVLGTLSIYGDRSKLFAALAKAQAGYAPIKRTRTVQVRSDKGNYTFDYAPLEEVISATLPSLNAQGLAWFSALADGEGEDADLHTMLTHESGAFIHVTERLPPVSKAQERGSQVTYRRRYQYQCVTGTSPEVDDDGNAADGNKVEGVTQRQAPRREPPAPAAKPAPPPAQKAAEPPREAPKTTVDPGVGEPMSEELSAQVRQAFKDLGYGKGPEPANIARTVTGKAPAMMDQADALRLLAYLRDKLAEKAAGQ